MWCRGHPRAYMSFCNVIINEDHGVNIIQYGHDMGNPLDFIKYKISGL